MLDDKDKDLTREDIENLEDTRARKARLRRQFRQEYHDKTGMYPSERQVEFELHLHHCADLGEMEEHIANERAKAKRAGEAIDAAHDRGEVSDFNQEMYHDWLNRHMTHQATEWSLAGVGLSSDIIQKEIARPWDRFLRQAGAMDRTGPKEAPDDDEDEGEEPESSDKRRTEREEDDENIG